MEQIVTGCKDCLLYNDGNQYEYAHHCKHPNSPQKVGSFTSEPEIELYIDREGSYPKTIPITPDWCPLKKEPITISIKE